ncbi:helix-turn-helix transcriptional regulator [Methylobacterium sp. WL120]|uniref:helix-turn-helix domain-containing protein n=1 Tax=Methylobacterium sp. WL120 TaxID=2603887 RepID=UPI0011C870BF|nr:helix-turn-helix transcriptional regulator [Methylobacterium sp. WL120]TXM69636.1 helix-turn-helix transcriptional regulator [Methylobacterium sp. WL120]
MQLALSECKCQCKLDTPIPGRCQTEETDTMDDVMTDQENGTSSSKLVRSQEQLTQTRAEFIQWIDHILTRKKWTGTDLANHSGMAPSTILRIMNSKDHSFNISFKTIRKVSEGSGFPIPRSLMEAHDVKHVDGVPDLTPKVRHTPARQTAPPQGQQAGRTIRVKYVSALPSSLVQSPREDMYEACPPQMMNDETAFAFRMPDDALAPLIRGGMMMFATKRRDPSAGEIVLIVDNAGRAKVRLVTDVNESGIGVRKLCDEDVETIPFDDVKEFGVVDGIWRRS